MEFSTTGFLSVWLPILIQFAPGIVIALLVYLHMRGKVDDAYHRGKDEPSDRQQNDYDQLYTLYERERARNDTLRYVLHRYMGYDEDQEDDIQEQLDGNED